MSRLLMVGVFALSLSAGELDQPRVEAGVVLGGLREGVFREYPVVGGGRVSVHTFRFVDAEVEVNRFPIGGAASSYPATQALFGLRAGRRIGNLGVYGKLRPGFISFDSNPYVPALGRRAALDAGGILELYSRRHIAGRMDFGDTVVWYGTDLVITSISGVGGSVTAGTRHQLQWSVGLSVWF
jgi:hypothetical protein